MKKMFALWLALAALTLIFLLSSASAANAAPAIPISNANELAKIGTDPQYPLDGDYVLSGNISLDATWIPIAPDSTMPFSGTLNGMGHSITVDWDGEGYSIFRYVTDARFEFMQIHVSGIELRTTLAYYATDSTFSNISVDGAITKRSYQMGGLVWAASNCVFEQVDSSVDLTLTDISFDRYNIVGGIACQITAESDDLAWSNGVYASKFIRCRYDGTISIDLTKAVYTGATNTSLWVGNLYGASAYDSPPIYFGVYIENSVAAGVFDITGTLDETAVPQFSFIDATGTVHAAYDPTSKPASVKTEEDIVRYGRTHINVHVTDVCGLLERTSYGYYGASGNETNAGEPGWSETKLSRMGLLLALTTAFLFLFIMIVWRWCCCSRPCKIACCRTPVDEIPPITEDKTDMNP